MALETHISKAEAAKNPEQILDRMLAGETVVIDDSEGAAVAEISNRGIFLSFSMGDRLQVIRFLIANLLEPRGSSPAIEADKTIYAWSAPAPTPRTISEVLALLDPNSTAVMDADFARDVEAAIESHREPLNPPAWE
jgi:hypothetical protein